MELYDDLLPNAGAIASYIPAAQSDVYNQASDFYGGQAVIKISLDMQVRFQHLTVVHTIRT